ncbi:GGDEF domain-containing protein [Sphingomonas antarctica]|uniref:GGDEF domain-containing protein n=1 Tax=Sphingomonas antarctica TaxID=2040274 RepID=UPI0039EB61CA
MSSATQADAENALAFLAQQWLPPTPENYTLAYIALTEPKSQIGRAVNAITEGGVRIRQGEADEIVTLYASENAHAEPASNNDAERDALRHQTIKLGEVASSAAAATGAFTRDLSAEAEGFAGDEARTVQIVTRMIERSRRAEEELNAAAKEVESLREELEAARDDAERDQLTGLGNRRAIDRHLQRLADGGRPRAIGICDIDHFKSVNDRFGHGVGDRVLKLVASSLAASCAPHFVGRWGGEEFLVVMDDEDQDSGMALLDAARADLSVRKLKLRENDEPLGVISFSAGVAVTSGDHGANIAAIHRADTGLYCAKAQGRNRVLAS